MFWRFVNLELLLWYCHYCSARRRFGPRGLDCRQVSARRRLGPRGPDCRGPNRLEPTFAYSISYIFWKLLFQGLIQAINQVFWSILRGVRILLTHCNRIVHKIWHHVFKTINALDKIHLKRAWQQVDFTWLEGALMEQWPDEQFKPNTNSFLLWGRVHRS